MCFRPPKSHEILMFVCLQKAAKQCCAATKRGCTHCAGQNQTNIRISQTSESLSHSVDRKGKPRKASCLLRHDIDMIFQSIFCMAVPSGVPLLSFGQDIKINDIISLSLVVKL